MQRTCTNPWCQQSFGVSEGDLAFFEQVAPVFGRKRYPIPPPMLCPWCRHLRRMSFRNERTFYHRRCDLTSKEMIAIFPEHTPFPVYDIYAWRSDDWDPKTYGRPYDFSRPFFAQYKDLVNVVPHYSRLVDPSTDVNCEYTNCAGWNKNCYLLVQSSFCEECHYGRSVIRSQDCIDCLGVLKCERCYECIDSTGCTGCRWCKQCDGCSDCTLCSDLMGCHSCFGCHNLRHQEYCLFNTPLDPREWKKRTAELTHSRETIVAAAKKSEEVRSTLPRRAAYSTLCENVTGDHNVECRNCSEIFDSYGCEDCHRCIELTDGKSASCRDYSLWGDNAELLYECNACGTAAHRLLFCDSCWMNVDELLYCQACYPRVRHCFGCYGLRDSEYCILNTQYTSEEYETLVPKIIEHMRQTGEYGEFFPASLSSFPYHDSLAHERAPLSEKQTKERGFVTAPKRKESQETNGVRAAQTPSTIDSVMEDILEKPLLCAATNRPFRIIKQELAFYRSMHIPLPLYHPDERHRRRMTQRNPPLLTKRICMKCGKDMFTNYPSNPPHILYCEECFQASVQ